MSIDPELWAKKHIRFPHWPCPTCSWGKVVCSDGDIAIRETGRSKAYAENVGEPDGFEGRFSAILTCENGTCGEVVVATGTVRNATEGDYHFINDFRAWNEYYVEAIHPAPPLFPLSKNASSAVATAIQSAFGLYWTDLESCANKIRKAVELILTEQGFPKKSSRESLHTRIGRFASVPGNEAISTFLLPLKYVGNSGSHEDNNGLDREDILSSFELIEHLVNVLDTVRALKDKASKLNIKHGPRTL